jgi:hypothetical protein
VRRDRRRLFGADISLSGVEHLSSETVTDTAPKPNFDATAVVHVRVRTAVLPACSIEAPKRSNSSSASASETGCVTSSRPEIDVTPNPIITLDRPHHRFGADDGMPA